MKKLILLILTVFLLFSLFSCGKKDDKEIYTMPGPPDPIGDYDETESFDAGSERGAFTVRVKKFTQGDANVAVLRLENNSASDFDVTVTGTFYGADGEAFATKTASLPGFSAGAGNFCILEPGAAYDTLEVSLETAPCEEAYLKYFGGAGSDTTFEETVEQEKSRGIPEQYWNYNLLCRVTANSSYTDGRGLMASIVFGVYSDSGEFICTLKREKSPVSSGQYWNLGSPFKAEKDGDKYVVPERLRGDFRYFFSVVSAVPWDGTIY